MKRGLQLNLESVLAQQRIERGDVNWRDPDSVFETFLLAYDDVERAEDARFESLKMMVDEKCSPERQET